MRLSVVSESNVYMSCKGHVTIAPFPHLIWSQTLQPITCPILCLAHQLDDANCALERPTTTECEYFGRIFFAQTLPKNYVRCEAGIYISVVTQVLRSAARHQLV